VPVAGNPEDRTLAILVSPLRVGRSPRIPLLVGADLLKHYLAWKGESACTFIGVSHGGLWAARAAGLKGGGPQALEKLHRQLEESLRRSADRLRLSPADRSFFTLEEDYRRTAVKAFQTLFEQGALCRRSVVVPWCPNCRTSLDPDRNRKARRFKTSALVVLVALKGTEKSLPVPFTEPELLGACVGLAVHPEDKRFAPLAGKAAKLPLYGREVRIVSTSYETTPGSLRPLLPAYDQGDLKLAQANKLQVIDVLDEAGRLNAQAGRYGGLDRKTARDWILADLAGKKAVGGLHTVEKTRALCEICGTELTWRYSEEWFVDMMALGEPVRALGLLRRIEPASFRTQVLEESNRELWCISRRCAWGLPLPVWYCGGCADYIVSEQSPDQCPQCGCENFHPASEKLAAGFLAALLPLVAKGYGSEEEEPAAGTLAVDTEIFHPEEAESAFLTLCLCQALDPDSLPAHIVRMGVESGSEDSSEFQAPPDALRLSLAAGGQLTPKEAEDLLGRLVRLVESLVADGCRPAASDKALPLPERWLQAKLHSGTWALQRCLEARRITYSGAVLATTVLRPLVDVYGPAAARRPQEAKAAALYEIAMRVVPYLQLFAPETAARLQDLLFERLMNPSSFPQAGPPQGGKDLLDRVRAFVRVASIFEKEPGAAAGGALRCRRSQEADFREIARAFERTDVAAAFDRPAGEGPCAGRMIGDMALLVPVEDQEKGNVERLIERLRERQRRHGGAQQQGSEFVEFIAELRRFAGGERPLSGSREP